MFDGRVIADVEMQKRLFFEGTPIAAIHRRVVPHVEGASDNFSLSLGQHQANMRCKPTLNLIEKFRREGLPAIVVPIDMAFIEAKHGAHLRSREISPFESPD